MLNYYTSEGVQPRLWYQYDRAGCPTTTAMATTAVTSTITTCRHLSSSVSLQFFQMSNVYENRACPIMGIFVIPFLSYELQIHTWDI